MNTVFFKLVRKFEKAVNLGKWTFELIQTLVNKIKNAKKWRFTHDGDPNGI